MVLNAAERSGKMRSGICSLDLITSVINDFNECYLLVKMGSETRQISLKKVGDEDQRAHG